MVIHDLHVIGTVVPAEADSPLIVDADAVLPRAVPAQRLQAISRRDAEVCKGDGVVEHSELAARARLNILGQLLGEATFPNFLGVLLLGQATSGRLLVVCHTDRSGTIRIISARFADKRERAQYGSNDR